MTLDSLLEDLKCLCTARPVDEKAALEALERLMEYLVSPANNTDANCKTVDAFVDSELNPWVDPDHPELALDVPNSVREILDSISTLHDTHSAPQIAENFGGTPAQLLQMTKKALRQVV